MKDVHYHTKPSLINLNEQFYVVDCYSVASRCKAMTLGACVGNVDIHCFRACPLEELILAVLFSSWFRGIPNSRPE